MTTRKARNIFLVLAALALANIVLQIATGPDTFGMVAVAISSFAAGAWAITWLRAD